METQTIVHLASEIFGWVYVLAWSITFYPQIYLIVKNRSSRGLSLESVVLTFLGAAAYFVHVVLVKYFYGVDNAFHITDVVFTTHILFVVIFLLVLTLKYRDDEEEENRITVFGKCLLAAIITLTIAAVVHCIWTKDGWVLVNVFAYVKLITTLKYVSQIYENWYQQSTEGFSQAANALDALGSATSILQVLFFNIETPMEIIVSWPKLALGTLCLVFNTILYAQYLHYFNTVASTPLKFTQDFYLKELA